MKEPETAGDQFEFFGTESLCVDTYNGTKTMVVIPNEHESLPVTSMDGYLFGGESIVEAIRLNDNITTIQELAFGENKNLKIVVLGKSVQTIEKFAFQGCESLHTLILNEGLLEIEEMVFFGCSALKEVTIPAAVNCIDSTAFMKCHADFTIYGEAGSYAETYAAENNIPFVVK